MGHETRTDSFTPEDTETSFYIPYQSNVDDMMHRAQERWPGIQVDEICIEPQHIQTYCLGYDRYDPMDYTNYLCVYALDEYFERTKKEK